MNHNWIAAGKLWLQYAVRFGILCDVLISRRKAALLVVISFQFLFYFLPRCRPFHTPNWTRPISFLLKDEISNGLG